MFGVYLQGYDEMLLFGKGTVNVEVIARAKGIDVGLDAWEDMDTDFVALKLGVDSDVGESGLEIVVALLGERFLDSGEYGQEYLRDVAEGRYGSVNDLLFCYPADFICPLLGKIYDRNNWTDEQRRYGRVLEKMKELAGGESGEGGDDWSDMCGRAALV